MIPASTTNINTMYNTLSVLDAFLTYPQAIYPTMQSATAVANACNTPTSATLKLRIDSTDAIKYSIAIAPST